MRYRKRGRGSDLVSAAEIGAFVYCPEACRLQEGLGLEPGKRAALDAGDQHHAGKAVAERIAGGSMGIGRVLVILAVLVLLVLWMLSR